MSESARRSTRGRPMSASGIILGGSLGLLCLLGYGVQLVGCVDLERPPFPDRCSPQIPCPQAGICGADGYCRATGLDSGGDAPDAPGDLLDDRPNDTPREPAPPACHELTQEGCKSPLKCGLDCDQNGLVCMATGLKKLDQVCISEDDCVAGMTCACLADCRCRLTCRGSVDCASLPGWKCIGTLPCPGDPGGTSRVSYCLHLEGTDDAGMDTGGSDRGGG